jgi:hypothetical protein
VPTARQQFATPAEFLEHVLSAHSRPLAHANPDEDMQRLTRLDIDAYGITIPDPLSPYSAVVSDLANRVISGFRKRCGLDVTERCAIGPLANPSVNARCFRSAEGHYAIVLHHGLMALLHKHSKLLTAAVRPASVMYCNRQDPSTLTPETLVAWTEELGPIYRKFREVKGALVKLDLEASKVSTTMLTLGEAFVLGHEIGHFVAGHLEDESRFVADGHFPWREFAPPNALHEDEFEADRHGFDAMSDSFESVPKPLLLGAVVSTFDALRLAGAGAASNSHPSAMDRVHGLVEHNFSVETAALVRRWVDDGDRHAAVEALRTAR